jgi:hypothetical protein
LEYFNKYFGNVYELVEKEFVNLADGKYGRGYYRKNMLSNQFAEGGIVKQYGFTEAEIDKWEKENKLSQRKTQNPVVKEAITKMAEGKMTQDEYLKIVEKNNPIKPFDRVPHIPTLKEIVGSLTTNKLNTGIIGHTVEIPDGAYVASRLDIPAYDNYDVWVVSVHDGNKEGKVIGYGKTAYLKDVTFKTAPNTAMRIGMGLSTKSTFARMFGTWVNKSPEVVRNMAVRYINNPNWIQVGMNPFRHSWFYDKADGLPLVSAEEVIQVGALVLAKNAVKTTVDDTQFIVDKKNPAIKYSNGGKTKTLLAPNGKPSNLTHEQWHIVRTKAFKDWFGDWEKDPANASKVVDENGEPLVVFHFTNTEFNVFDLSKARTTGYSNLGFWFGSDKDKSNEYGRIEKSCYLKIDNAYYLSDWEDFEGDINRYSKTFGNEANEFREYLASKGHDGVIIDNADIDGIGEQTIYVAFEPTQIKLADGTNTTFDGSNPDIRFEKGGEIVQLQNVNKARSIMDGNMPF